MQQKQNKSPSIFVALVNLVFKWDYKKPYSNEHKLKLSSTFCVTTDAH